MFKTNIGDETFLKKRFLFAGKTTFIWLHYETKVRFQKFLREQEIEIFKLKFKTILWSNQIMIF